MVRTFYHENMKKRKIRAIPNDPGFNSQWYIENQNLDWSPRLDHNIIEAWVRGYTGKGVVVTVVDDGVDNTHIDLQRNYDSLASYNYRDLKADPNTKSETHGTKCVGLIGSTANNNYCGSGIAYDAKVGAIRILGGVSSDVGDTMESLGISHKYDYVDIYSMSWGPDDDGMTIDGPGVLTINSLMNGVLNGRSGRGNIFIFAAGNGGRSGDHCGYDGYLQRVEVMVIAAVTRNGTFPQYGEQCSAIFAVALSSSSDVLTRGIFTLEPNHGCGFVHSGTSVAAPIGAAIIALLLEAVPDIGWRQVQDLVVRSSRKIDHTDPGWVKNSAGFEHNVKYGFGLLDAGRLIENALSERYLSRDAEWNSCSSRTSISSRLSKNPSSLISRLAISGCLRSLSCVSIIESVIVHLDVGITQRGLLDVYLTSSKGTTTHLLAKRPNDKSKEHIKNLSVRSVAFWGEDPLGIWTLKIVTTKGVDVALIGWNITLFGSCDQTMIPSLEIYHKFCQTFIENCNLPNKVDHNSGKPLVYPEDCDLLTFPRTRNPYLKQFDFYSFDPDLCSFSKPLEDHSNYPDKYFKMNLDSILRISAFSFFVFLCCYFVVFWKRRWYKRAKIRLLGSV